MFGALGAFGYYLIMMISILNTVEYNQYKFGTRDEAIIASLRPFLTKMASALVVVITSVTYIVFGVTDYTNQISAYENMAAAGTISDTQKLEAIDALLSKVSVNQTNGLLFVMVLMSAVMLFISYVIYRKKYTLNEEEYDRICAELKK